MDHCLAGMLLCLYKVVVYPVDYCALGHHQSGEVFVYCWKFRNIADQFSNLPLLKTLLLLLLLQKVPLSLSLHDFPLFTGEGKTPVDSTLVCPDVPKIFLFLISKFSAGLLDLVCEGGFHTFQNFLGSGGDDFDFGDLPHNSFGGHNCLSDGGGTWVASLANLDIF